MEFLKRVHAKNILKWGGANQNAVVLSGDLTTSCEIDEFRSAYPERFISLGLMEQNMMSFAAGLAREGLLPLVHTFSVCGILLTPSRSVRAWPVRTQLGGVSILEEQASPRGATCTVARDSMGTSPSLCRVCTWLCHASVLRLAACVQPC